MNKVQILLSTYNGEKYISQLLNSLYLQKEKDFNILVRDDGSKDRTLNILNDYKKYNNIHILKGENLGFKKSFWKLIELAGDADYFAFCDQDDIWKEDKISAAISLLEKEDSNIPLLYTSNVIAVNNNLEIINEKGFDFEGILSFPDSLKRSVLPGCTFVFNKKSLQILKKYNGYIESHDWAVYAIISAFGKVVYDEQSHILYRIHENNTIGIDNKLIKYKDKFIRFFKPKSRNGRSKFAMGLYNSYKNELSENNQKLVYNLANYKSNIKIIGDLIKYEEYREVIFLILLFLGKV